jgi:PAS domain S-box-containing protein/putative nucleotidyltransferase with HDIG domain
VWCSDFATNPLTAPWHRRAAAYGWAAAAALPLRRHGQAIGALSIYTVDLDLQDADLQQLMTELTGNICVALDKLAAEAAARAHRATLMEAEQRFSALIEQSVAGAFIVQDDRFTYVNPRLCAMFGYRDAADLLGRSPRQLVAAKDLGRFTEQLAGVLAGELLHRHMLLTARRADGSPLEVAVDFALTHYQQRLAVVGLVQDLADREVAAQHIRRYTAQLENVFRQTVRLVTILVERRDPYTAGHAQRVGRLAVAIGKEMGLTDSVLQGLDVGGQLHDVGKMQVPVEILTKPGRLTDAEYALIKDHAQAGYDILKDVDFPWPVALIAAQHHERLDGGGYPRGLKGDQIILEARIVAVADVVEAMALHRPYRFSEGLDVALREIERGRGSAYDADVVDACLRLFRQKGYVLDGVAEGNGGTAQPALPAPALDPATDS